MLCMAETTFVAVIVSVSLLCVLFSAVIVAWGCSRLRRTDKLAAAAGPDPLFSAPPPRPTLVHGPV